MVCIITISVDSVHSWIIETTKPQFVIHLRYSPSSCIFPSFPPTTYPTVQWNAALCNLIYDCIWWHYCSLLCDCEWTSMILGKCFVRSALKACSDLPESCFQCFVYHIYHNKTKECITISNYGNSFSKRWITAQNYLFCNNARCPTTRDLDATSG